MKNARKKELKDLAATIDLAGPTESDMIPIRRDQLLGIAGVLGELPGKQVFSLMLWIEVAVREHDKQFSAPVPENRITTNNDIKEPV